MSYRFEMSNVKDSLTQLYHYVARIADENAWKSKPIILDSPMETLIKFPHPSGAVKDVKANSEPFSIIAIHLPKPHVPQLNIELAYDNKKSAARFCDMLQERNKNIGDEFFAMVHTLDGFSFKVQVKTTFKNVSSAKYEDVFIAPASSVSIDDVIQNVEKVVDMCGSKGISEDDKVVKYRGTRISICRDFPIDDLALEQTWFDGAIKSFHEFMLSEPKISSEKDIEKSIKERKKIEGKTKFYTIISNRADKEFYCQLTKAEFERIPDNIGIQVWDTETFEEKKYIKGALKLVREI
jgi:hypothetical protein